MTASSATTAMAIKTMASVDTMDSS